MCSSNGVTMTLMMMGGVIVDVSDQNRAAVGTPNVVRSQMNFKGQSPILKGELAAFWPEIGLPIISVDRFENDTIDILDLDR